MSNFEYLMGFLRTEKPMSMYEIFFSGGFVLTFVFFGISEATNLIHMQYSKFWSANSALRFGDIKVSGKYGMLLFYTPPLIAGISSFLLFPGGDVRFLMLKSAFTFQFLKRDLEVLFLHKFSGFVVLSSVFLVAFYYLAIVSGTCYFDYMTHNFPEPSIDLKYIGLLLFVVGILGNFYHHLLLARLRNKSEKGYKIPTGGLFGFITCPHYVFEIIIFVGLSFISQTLFSFACAIAATFYLAGRSYATRKWYRSKFEDYPKNVKLLIPFVF